MARCRAATPCEFYDDVHDPGCPERRGAYQDPELAELYATETAEERARLGVVLDYLLDAAFLDTEHHAEADSEDVTGGEPEWLVLRRAVRAGEPYDHAASRFVLRWEDDAPALHLRPGPVPAR